MAVPRASKRRGFRDAMVVLWRDKAALIGAIYLVLLMLAAVFAPFVMTSSPTMIDILARLEPPAWLPGGSASHLLGTDSLGRDMLARLVYGARVSLIIGVSVVAFSAIVGVALGIVAGYKGGRTDTIIMRVADAQLAFPGLLLVLLVIAFVGPSIPVIIVVVALYGWMIYARLVRSVVLQLKASPAIQGAELLGASTPRILVRHVLPVLSSLILTQGMLELARVMLVEASLSFLGYGVQPPDASWGLMVAENQSQLTTAWWTAVFPGVALALTVIAINLVANWLRALTDPKQREARLAPRPRVQRRRRTDGAARELVADRSAAAPQGRDALLEVEHMTTVFETTSGPVPAVRDVSFAIAPGETVGIVGESGSGKSSTALALMGLIPPPGHVDGIVRWQGSHLSPGDLRKLRGSEITMIFQDPMTSLNPLVPVGRQVAEVLRAHKGMSKRAAMARVIELFELVGIPSPRERLKQYPFQLSGGLRQRVMIACALAPEPKLIIADEPTTALDATVQAQILEVIASVRTRMDLAMLLISHDLGVVAGQCDRVMVFYGGRLVEESATDELFAAPRHRYTQALLAASPRIDRHSVGRLATIPGQPPTRLGSGPECPFRSRCGFATDACASMPPMEADGAKRRFACWHPVAPRISVTSDTTGAK